MASKLLQRTPIIRELNKNASNHHKLIGLALHRRNFSIQNTTTSEGEKIQETDVLIVGGGIAGASLACALSSSEYFAPSSDQSESSTHSTQGKRIVLLDHSKLPSLKSYSQEGHEALKRIPEPRVITLSPNSLRFLKSIGALQKCNHRYVTEFDTMLVYEEHGSSYMKFGSHAREESLRFFFTFNCFKSPLIQLQEALMKATLFRDNPQVLQETQAHMGASIENNHLLASLVETAKSSGKVQIIPQKVVEVRPAKTPGERPLVRLEDGTLIQSKLLVGSDGEKSKVREEYGIRANGYSYGQNVCTVRSLSPNTIAFQRFLKTGPLAVLPLWQNFSSIVWSCHPELCQELTEAPEENLAENFKPLMAGWDYPHQGALMDFTRSEQARFQYEAPPLIEKLETKRFAFPLTLMVPQNLASHRMALIGDAAHRIKEFYTLRFI